MFSYSSYQFVVWFFLKFVHFTEVSKFVGKRCSWYPLTVRKICDPNIHPLSDIGANTRVRSLFLCFRSTISLGVYQFCWCSQGIIFCLIFFPSVVCLIFISLVSALFVHFLLLSSFAFTLLFFFWCPSWTHD